MDCRRRGSALISIIMLLSSLMLASLLLFTYHRLTGRSLRARAAQSEVNTAAESVARVMIERLTALAEHRLGIVEQVDIDSLNAETESIPLPPGLSLATSRTAYTITATYDSAYLPYDEAPLRVTTDLPRFAFRVPPIAMGVRADRTTEVLVTAEVLGRRGARGRATAKLAFSRVLPYQHAIYTAGDLDACVSPGSSVVVVGRIRAHGALYSRCEGDRVYVGEIIARDSMIVTGTGSHVLQWNGGSAILQTVRASDMRSAVPTVLRDFGGRVRIAAALGSPLAPTAFQDSLTAGWGECPDFDGACSGMSSFFPSVEIQRTTAGPDTTFTLHCGWAYHGVSCDDVRRGIRYHPFPFTTAGAPGQARLDPMRPGQLWQGLFPDYRRETRCTANMGQRTFQTFRCPTNPYGFVIDVGELPAIEGGLLSIRQASTTDSINNASGFQEVVLLRNASTLNGALTIVSEIPVYIEGSFNVVDPKPAMIDAPLISLLPAEAAIQLHTASVWDSTATTVHEIIKAYSSVQIHAVLRAAYHPTSGSAYYGGTIEQIPSVLGDFSGVTVSVIGAVEGRAVPPGTVGSYSTAFAAYGAEPSGMKVQQPSGRRVVFDDRLLSPDFQPPGSWAPENLPSSGAGGTRTRERQANARGGYMIVRLLQEVTRSTTEN